MTNEEQQELAELKAQSKLKPKDRARLKILERKIKKAEQEEKAERENTPANRSVFAPEPTTKMAPHPIRFFEMERDELTALKDGIKTDSDDLIVRRLSKIDKITEAILVRASILLLRRHTHEEIINAIVEIKRAELKSKGTKKNVFGIQEKPKQKTLSVRFSQAERTGLKTLADDILMNSCDMVIDLLYRTDEVSVTKLIRSAAHLLKQHNHEEIIDAIEEVKSGMFSAG